MNRKEYAVREQAIISKSEKEFILLLKKSIEKFCNIKFAFKDREKVVESIIEESRDEIHAISKNFLDRCRELAKEIYSDIRRDYEKIMERIEEIKCSVRNEIDPLAKGKIMGMLLAYADEEEMEDRRILYMENGEEKDDIDFFEIVVDYCFGFKIPRRIRDNLMDEEKLFVDKFRNYVRNKEPKPKINVPSLS